MVPDIDTKKIIRKVYLASFLDGFWDMFLGLFLLSWGITVRFDLPWLPGLVFVMFFWLILDLKKRVTYPRIGFAKPVKYRQRNLKIFIAGIVILALVVIALPVINKGSNTILLDYFEIIFSSLLAVAFALVGYLWYVNRWYIFAAAVFIFAVLNQWAGLSFHMSFILPGVLILLYGLYVFVRFLGRYPVVTGESADE